MGDEWVYLQCLPTIPVLANSRVVANWLVAGPCSVGEAFDFEEQYIPM